MSEDLITRLRAAIDEDERVALATRSETGRWSWVQGFGEMCGDRDCPYGQLLDAAEPASGSMHVGTVLMEVHGYDTRRPWEGAEHIARHDPARTLAMVAAHREILELHGPVVLRGGAGARYYDTKTVCVSCEPPKGVRQQSEIWPCSTLLALAKGYGIEVQ